MRTPLRPAASAAAAAALGLLAVGAAIARAGAAYSVSTLAGGTYGAADGAGANASFSSPIALAPAAAGDAVYVAEQGNHRVRIVWRNGTVGSLTGGGPSGFLSGVRDGNRSTALFYLPQALAVPAPGGPSFLAEVAVFVSEFGNYKVRAVSPNGTVWTIAGGGASGKTPGTADGVGTAAAFTAPSGIACFGGTLFVSDSTRLRAVALATGAVTTLAGSTVPGFANGVGAAAAFRGLAGLAALPGTGTLIVAETWYYDVRAVEQTGAVRALVGGNVAASEDGVGTAARFRVPAGLWHDAAVARLLLADTGGSRVIAIDPVAQSATTLFGGTSGFGDGDGAVAAFNNPSSAVAFSDGAIAIADQSNNAIRVAVLVSATPSPSGAPSGLSPSSSPTPSGTSSVSAQASAASTAAGSPTSATPTSSGSPPSVSSAPPPSGSPTSSPAGSAQASALESPTSSPSPSPSPSPSSTVSQSSSASVSPSPTVSQSSSASVSLSSSPSASQSAAAASPTPSGTALIATSSQLSTPVASPNATSTAGAAGLGAAAVPALTTRPSSVVVGLEAAGGIACVLAAAAAIVALRRKQQRRTVFGRRDVGEVVAMDSSQADAGAPKLVVHARRPQTLLTAPFASSSHSPLQRGSGV